MEDIYKPKLATPKEAEERADFKSMMEILSKSKKEMNSSLAYALMVTSFLLVSFMCISWYQAHQNHLLKRDLSVSQELLKDCIKQPK